MTMLSSRPAVATEPVVIRTRLARPAIRAIARREVRRGWAGLLVLGLLAGIAGAIATGAMVVERRTATAEARLRAVMGVEDLRLTSLGGEIPSSAGVPGIRREWRPGIVVGQVTAAGSSAGSSTGSAGAPAGSAPAVSGLTYMAVLSGPPHPGIFNPVVVEGRAARANSLDEVTVSETIAQNGDIRLGVGSVIRLHLLSAAQADDWSSGIGEPQGPEITLRVVGMTRITPKSTNGVGIMASQRFYQEYGRRLTQGGATFIQVQPGLRPEAVAQQFQQKAPGAQFQADFSSRETAPVRTSAHILTGGALSFVLVAALAGLVGLIQFSSRHHTASVHAQQVEHALGLTGTERVLGHALPSLISAAVAAVLTVAGGIAGGYIEPLGALRSSEPSPGFRLDLGTTLAGALIVVLIVVSASVATAGRVMAPPFLTGLPRRGSRLFRWPVPSAALRLVAGRRGSMRLAAAVSGIVIATTGMIAAVTVLGSLRHLVDTPANYGITSDLSVADARPELIDQLRRDARVRAIGEELVSRANLGGRDITSYADRRIMGRISWTLLDGRDPVVDDEVVLGARLARALNRWTGDVVTLNTRHGPEPYRVTGVGIGPYDGESFGTNALFTPGGIGLTGLNAPYSNLIADLAPDVDRDAYGRELSRQWELSVTEPPVEVSSLNALGSLPVYLAVFFGVAGLAALGHSAYLLLRRSRRDLAVLHTIGFTKAQVGSVVLTAVTVTGAAGVLIGIPLGLAVGRLVWVQVAGAIGVLPGVQLPIGFALLTVPAGIALAALVAARPSWRAARMPLGQALRTE